MGGAGPPARRALLLVNAKARRGDEAIDSALAVLRERGFTIETGSCGDRDALAATIRRRAAGFDCVIVGGGDGTLNAAAPALVETGLPLGILPLGTANDLARTLGIEADPVAAAAVIADWHLRRIDLGQVNDRYFFNVASIGLSVELARGLTHDMKRRWGTLGYAIAALRIVVRARPFHAELIHDGKAERVRTVQIGVGNGRHYGGGLSVDESAEPDDGLLNVYSVEISHWMQLARIYPAFRAGQHATRPEIRSFPCREVEIRTRRPRSINTDGEVTERTPARFKVIPGAVTILAPRAETAEAAA